MRIIEKCVVSLFVAIMLINLCSPIYAEAKASSEAMEFLRGTWVTYGNSQSVKVVFTKKYMKFYDCFAEDFSYILPGKELGELTRKSKILSTKKKGGKWVVKVENGNFVEYYTQQDDSLILSWKNNGEWITSYSDSLERL